MHITDVAPDQESSCQVCCALVVVVGLLAVADVVTESVSHTLVIALDLGDVAGLDRLELADTPIVDGLRLPPGSHPR